MFTFNALTPLNWINWILLVAAFVVEAWAFVDALRRPTAAFPAAGKRTKPLWLIITGLCLVVGFFYAAYNLPADQHPADRGVHRGGDLPDRCAPEGEGVRRGRIVTPGALRTLVAKDDSRLRAELATAGQRGTWSGQRASAPPLSSGL